MHTLETRYPDGTRATYKVAPGSTVPLALAALKPAKRPRGKADKRQFPAYRPGVDSTADYVRAYFARNTGRKGGVFAYDDYLDHLALYAPLPEAPAVTYAGVDTVETVED